MLLVMRPRVYRLVFCLLASCAPGIAGQNGQGAAPPAGVRALRSSLPRRVLPENFPLAAAASIGRELAAIAAAGGEHAAVARGLLGLTDNGSPSQGAARIEAQLQALPADVATLGDLVARVNATEPGPSDDSLRALHNLKQLAERLFLLYPGEKSLDRRLANQVRRAHALAERLIALGRSREMLETLPDHEILAADADFVRMLERKTLDYLDDPDGNLREAVLQSGLYLSGVADRIRDGTRPKSEAPPAGIEAILSAARHALASPSPAKRAAPEGPARVPETIGTLDQLLMAGGRALTEVQNDLVAQERTFTIVGRPHGLDDSWVGGQLIVGDSNKISLNQLALSKALAVKRKDKTLQLAAFSQLFLRQALADALIYESPHFWKDDLYLQLEIQHPRESTVGPVTATLRIFENGRLQVVIRMESRLPEARARKSEKKKSAAPLSAQHLDHILNKERTLAVKETEGSGNGFENFRGGDVLLNPDIIEKRQVALRDVLAGDRWLIGDPNSGEVFWRLPVRGKWKQKSATAEILEYELKDSWKDRSYRLTVRLAAGNPPEPFQVADVKLSMHEGEAALFSIVLEDISSNPL